MIRKIVILGLVLALCIATIPGVLSQPNSNPNWYGYGRDYLGYPDRNLYAALIDWSSEIERMKDANMNIVRLAFAFDTGSITYHSDMDFVKMDAVVELFGKNEIGVIFDLHNWRDHYDFFGSPSWISQWVGVANYYKDNEYVIAYELFNEPFTENWYSTVQNGGCGFSGGEDVLEAYAQCVDSIRATGDSHTIIYADPWFIRGTTDQIWLNSPFPSNLQRDNIVITFHEWQDNSGNFNLNDRKGRMTKWSSQFPIWVGEFGVFNNQQYNTQVEYISGIIKHAKSLGSGWEIWMHGYSGITQGWKYFSEIVKIEMPDKL